MIIRSPSDRGELDSFVACAVKADDWSGFLANKCIKKKGDGPNGPFSALSLTRMWEFAEPGEAR